MKKLLLMTVAIGLLAAPAMAFTVTDVEMPYNDTLDLTAPVSVEAYVGQDVLTTSIGTIDAWCIDMYHDINLGGGQSLPYSIGTITDNGAGLPLSNLQILEISGLMTYGDAQMVTAPSNDVSAAIQLAIWTVEYPTFAYTGGDPDLSALLANDLSLAPGLASGSTGFALIPLNGQQGLAMADPVPEPISIAVFGSALLGLGVARRRRI